MVMKAFIGDLTPLIKEESTSRTFFSESKLTLYELQLKAELQGGGPVLGKNTAMFGAVLALRKYPVATVAALEADGKIALDLNESMEISKGHGRREDLS